MFVCGGRRGDMVREVLYIGGPDDVVARPGQVIYADPYGGGRCSLWSLAIWAKVAVPEPNGWVRRSADLESLAARHLLPEQDGVTPEFPFSAELSRRAQMLVKWALRDGGLEDIHAGPAVPAGSKVVTPDGAVLAWEEVGRVTDDEMRRIAAVAVDRIYTMLTFPDAALRLPEDWDDARLDERMMAGLRAAGFFGPERRDEGERVLERLRREGGGGGIEFGPPADALADAPEPLRASSRGRRETPRAS